MGSWDESVGHISEIHELTEEECLLLESLSEQAGETVVDDGNGYWHTEDRDGNITGTGWTTEKGINDWWHKTWEASKNKVI